MDEITMVLENITQGINMMKGMGDERGLAAALSMRGLLYFQVGQFSEAIGDSTQAINIMERIRRSGQLIDENELAKAYAGRAMSYHVINDNAQAIPDLNSCIKLWERLQKESQAVEEGFLFSIYIIRAGLLNTTYDGMDIAISDCHKSIAIAKRLHEAGEDFDVNGLASAYMGIAVSCDQKEAFEEANANYDECLEIWEELKNAGEEVEESNMASAYMNRGSNYYQMGQIDRALLDYNKCIAIRERLQKENSDENDIFDLFMAYKNRSQAYELDNNTKSAIKDLVVALQVAKGAFSSHIDIQKHYYDILEELIELIAEERNNELLQRILQEFLHSMRQIPKTPDAERAQNNLLRQFG